MLSIGPGRTGISHPHTLQTTADFAPDLIAAKPVKPCDRGVFGALNLLLKKEQILMLAAPGRPRQIIARPMNTPATPASASSRPVIAFPPELPVSARRAEIEAALQKHQVIIVCGETGSGKTTQLPKMALARGRLNAQAGERGRLIGHTQPRRIVFV